MNKKSKMVWQLPLSISCTDDTQIRYINWCEGGDQRPIK